MNCQCLYECFWILSLGFCICIVPISCPNQFLRCKSLPIPVRLGNKALSLENFEQQDGLGCGFLHSLREFVRKFCERFVSYRIGKLHRCTGKCIRKSVYILVMNKKCIPLSKINQCKRNLPSSGFLSPSALTSWVTSSSEQLGAKKAQKTSFPTVSANFSFG